MLFLKGPVIGQGYFPVKADTIVFQQFSKKSAKTEINTTVSSACITSTFFKHYKVTGQKIEIAEVQTLQNGNFLVAGNITLSNAQPEGFLCIINNRGSMVSQSQLRINNLPITIYTLKVKANGDYLVGGVLHDATDKVFIAQLKNNLTTDWLKLITTPAVPTNVKLDCTDNGDVFFAAKLTNSIYYSLLNVSGVQQWSRTSFPAGLDDLVGIGHVDYGEISLITNCTRAALKVVEHTIINQSTGASITSHTLGNGTDENYFTRVTSFNNRVIFSGIKKTSSAQFKLTRDISYSSTNIETEHNYTIPGVVDFNTSSAMDHSGDAMGFCFPAQGKLVFIRQFADYSTELDFTRQYTVPAGSNIRSVTRSLLDGGFLFALNSADSSEFILIKTDSIGTLPTCGFSTVNNSFTETLNQANSSSSSTSGGVANNAVTAAVSFSAANLSSTADCDETYCPPAAPEDTCMPTYLKLLRSNSHYDAFNSFYLMRNNVKLMATTRVNRIWNEGLITYGLKRFDEKGNFINGVNMPPNTQTNISFIKRINDQRIMLVTNSQIGSFAALTFTLIDDDMQIIWTKTVKTFYLGGEYNGSSYSPDLTTDAEGNFYFVANNLGFGAVTRKVLVYKMDANGNPVWVKLNEVAGGSFYTSNITCTNTSVIVVAQGTPRSASVRLDKASGQLLNAYTFITTPAGSGYRRFLKYDNGRIYYSGNSDSHFTMGLFDTTGKPYRMKSIDQNGSGAQSCNVRNGNFFSGYTYFNGAAFKNVLLKTDTGLSLIFAKEYNNSSQFLFGNNLEISDEGNIYAAGNYSHGGSNGSYYDQIFVKFDSSGNLGTCGFNNYSPPIIDLNFDVQTAVANQFTNNFTVDAPLPNTFTADTLGHRISAVLCSSAANCNSINLTGTDIICQLNQPFTYQANRNPGCNGIATWIYDTTYAVLQSNTDTSATFTFRIPGNTWLKARISTGCSFIIDSILIQIQNSPQFFSLGPDDFLCPGSTIQLHAGQGFSAYLWQDNSTDSVFNVTTPGMYYVQVNNLCGDEFRDTIIIAAAIIPPLNIGSDASVCYADTLSLSATPGFSSYAWQPIALINGSGQQVFVVPLQNEQITIIATTSDGCKAYDTLNITRISARPIWLGEDTSFCQGGSLTLSAGSGYTQYLWSTGAITTSITANQQGLYWVKALDINGCYAKDSFEIKQVYTNPKPNLGSNFNICLNETKILDAGNYSNYKWNTGATTRAISVSTTGDYWVLVIDNNNCKGIDSVELTGILPLPINFLRPVDSICQRENLTISSLTNFNTYLWSTGAISSTIQVASAGQYILTVSDNNNCTGKDSILIVAKNCTRAVYIPNAFTPNNDASNDLFKVKVYGSLLTFHIEIFNRYGQLVFAASNPLQGWDGTYKGKLQPVSTYTWRCTYQFEGKMFTQEKGTLILIR